MPQQEILLDTTYSVETPEGIDLQVDLAGPVPRAYAYLIDLLIRLVIQAVLFIPAAFAGKAGVGLWFILTFMLEWWYPVLFEVFRKGQTPGKKIYNIAVTNDDLTPVRWSASLVRNLLRAADFLPLMYVFGMIASTLSPKFQRLGDLAAGTIVVHKKEQSDLLAIPEVDAVSPPFSLNESEQAAIIEFTQRHNTLSEERQRELAEILENLSKPTTNDSVGYLRGIGNWLLGAR